MSAVVGSKSTTREMSIPVPTFGHTPFVVDNFENGSDEATTNVKGRTRFEKTLVICSHGPVGRVLAPHTVAATATVHSRKLRFFLIQQIILELRLSFPVGISEPVYLFIYVY